MVINSAFGLDVEVVPVSLCLAVSILLRYDLFRQIEYLTILYRQYIRGCIGVTDPWILGGLGFEGAPEQSLLDGDRKFIPSL